MVHAAAPRRLPCALALVVLTSVVLAWAQGAASAQGGGSDGTVIINPGLQVRVSPAALTQDVPMPVTVLVLDAAGRPVVGAAVRLSNAANPAVVLGMGVTGAGGRAVIGPVRATAAEVTPGVRVETTSQAGTRNDLIIPVRPPASSFAVLEARIIEPAEGSRVSLAEGQPLRIVGLLRGIGTGTVTGWWEVNGMPVAPFSARIQSGAPVRVEPRDAVLLAARLRIGPNDIRLRTIVPNEVTSRETLVDVYRDLVAERRGSARVEAACLLLGGIESRHCQTPIGAAPPLSVEVVGTGTGQITGEWWLDGAYADAFEAPMRDGTTGPLPVPGALLPVGRDATHYLRLRVTSPGATDSPVFAYDVGTATGSEPATIQLLSPAEGADVTALPPVLRWTPVPAAIRYHVSVGLVDGDQRQALWTGAVRATPGEFVELRTPAFLVWEPGRTYFWKVVALRPSQDAPASEVGTFKIPAPPSPGGDAQ